MKKIVTLFLVLTMFLPLVSCDEKEHTEVKREELVVTELELSHNQLELLVGESTYLTVKGEVTDDFTYYS